MDWESGVGRCRLLHLEWINNEVLMYSTGNYTQYPVISRSERVCIVQCMCITELLYSRGWHNIVNQLYFSKGFPGGTVVKNLSAKAGDARDPGLILSGEDPLKQEMATHCSILAWEIPWTEEPSRLQSMGL